MCVPCVAAAPELLPILFMALLVIGTVLSLLARSFLVGFLLIGAAVWRFFSGAVLVKGFAVKDADYWAARPDKRPRFTRNVRAAFRAAAVMVPLGVAFNVLALVLVTSSLGVLTAAYGYHADRARIAARPRAQLDPVKVRSQIGAGR